MSGLGRLYACLACRKRLGEVRRGEIAVCVACGQAHALSKGGMLVRSAGDRAAAQVIDRLARRLMSKGGAR